MSSSGARRFLPILAVQFIGTLGFSIALPILVFLVSGFGGVSWTYGLVLATYSAFQLVGAPVLGRWSDRIGRRRVLVLSQAGTLAGWLLFLLAFALPKDQLARLAGASITWPLVVIFAARAFDGLTGGNVSVANAYVADLTIDEERTRQRAFGWMGMAASLGFSIGPALAALLIGTRFGYVAPVFAAAVLSAVASAMCWVLPEAPNRCPDEPPPQPTVTKVLGQEQRPCHREPAKLADAARVHDGVRRLLVATFVLFVAFNVFYAIFPVHAASELGWNPRKLGVFYTLMSLGLIAAEGPVLDASSKFLGPRSLFTIGMMLLAVAFVGFTTDESLVVFTGAALFALGNGLAWPTFQARIADAAGPAAQGAVQGAAASASSLASIVGLIVGALLYSVLERALFAAAALLFFALGLGARLFFASTAHSAHGGSSERSRH